MSGRSIYSEPLKATGRYAIPYFMVAHIKKQAKRAGMSASAYLRLLIAADIASVVRRKR